MKYKNNSKLEINREIAHLCYDLEDKAIIPYKSGVIVSPVDNSDIYNDCFNPEI